MPNDFLHISKATLWDNLKRKANEDLRMIQSSDKKKVLKSFNEKYPKKIQSLLKNIGKEFFKIFYYQSLKDKVNFKYNEESIQKHLEEVTADFKFYFWPGYTTLSGKRIVIAGENKGVNVDDDFLTGIGNTHLNLRDKSRLEEYLTEDDSLVNSVFSYEGSFWIRDIPSTVAFDKVLNQRYIDKLLGNGVFKVPSTHLWKSSQKRSNGDFIPMPLMDGSEFRILEISFGGKSHFAEKNKISISIPTNELHRCGHFINKRLSKDEIPINWQEIPDDQRKYNEWPFTSSDEHHLEAQIAAYTFWLRETLNTSNDFSINYDNLRNVFNNAGLQELGKEIITFKTFSETFFKPKKLTQIHYNYWYTSYMESYNSLMDLGSAMFLTSHQYDSEFIMKCTNWLRWIYNELRVIEATAKTSKEEYEEITHRQNSHLISLDYWSSLEIEPNIDEHKFKVFKNYLSSVSAFSRIDRLDSYNLKIKNIELKKLIADTSNVFKLVLNDYDVFDYTFSLGLDEIHFELLKDFKFLQLDLPIDEIVIQGDRHLFELLLKDVLENIIKYCDKKRPSCAIKLSSRKGEVELQIINSKWPSEDNFEKMKENSFPFENIGWRSINKIIKLHSWDIKLPKSYTSAETTPFVFKITIPL